MSTMCTLLAVLCVLTALVIVGLTVRCVIDEMRTSRQRRSVQTQTVLTEMELQRATRQAMGQLLDEARRSMEGRL